MDAAARWNRTMSRLRAIGVSHYGAGRIFGSGRTNKDEERRSARVLTPDRSHANPRPPERAREPIGCAASSHRKRPSPLSLGPRRPAGPARSPSLPRFLSRLPRAAARRALAALLLAGAGTVAVPAWADVLVSNIGQTRAVDWELASLYDLGQPFTTGSNVWGYTLSSIELRLDTSTGTTPPTVKVFSGSASGTEVAALSAPANLDASTRKNYTFTASGTVKLNASTTYWVVAEGGSNDVHWSSTASDSEDGTPATGWSVGDTGVLRNASETGSFQDNVLEYAMLIRVNGATITAPAVASAEVTAAKPKELVLTFDDALDTDSVPAASAFSVEIDGSAGPAVSSVAIDGDDATKLTLGLSVALTAGDSNVTVDYTQPASNPLQDAAENKVASFTGQDVTNNAAACPSGQPSAAFWTGCLTVGGTSAATGFGFFGSTGALSDTTVTYDGTDYTIDRLVSKSNLHIDMSFTSDPRPGSQEWLLRVGGIDLPFGHAFVGFSDTSDTYSFRGAHVRTFGFGTVPLWRAGDKLSVSVWRNRAPVLENAIPDQTAWVGQAFSFQIPANTFSDPEGHALTWNSAKLPGNQALPAWLTFEKATGTFTGKPASGDAGTLSVTVELFDAYLGVAEDTFDLVVRAPADLRLSSSSVAVSEGSEATYTVALAEAPHADVTVTVESDDTVTVSADGAYGMRADVEADADIGSVVLSLSGAKTVSRTESLAPWSLYGDRADGEDRVLNGASLPAGSYTLTATAYAERAGAGDVLGTLTVPFTVEEETAPVTPPPAEVLTGFVLLDASDQSTVATLSNNAAIDLEGRSGGSFAIRADVASDATVGSVVLSLSGAKTVSATESLAPYSLYGDHDDGNGGRALDGATLPAGTYTLSATAYAEGGGAGEALGTRSVSFEVLAPALLSVADARAEEGTDATLDFAVTLDRSSTGTVTVEYATSDGTATAGDDYTATSGTLTFAPGDREKTIAVPVLDDANDEGEETMTLRLSNASGANIADGEATGTITNSDPIQKMWLARFGRTVGSQVVDAVAERLGSPLTSAQVTLGGQGVDLTRTEDGEALAQALVGVARIFGAESVEEDDAEERRPGAGAEWREAWGHAPTGPETRSMSGRDVLLGSAFHLSRSGEDGGPGFAAWGRVTAGGFDAQEQHEKGAVDMDGEVTTGIVGADAAWERWLAGVAVSVSEGEGTYAYGEVGSGKLESTLTGVHPYARVEVNDRVQAWGLLGFGAGEMTMRPEGKDPIETDIDMRLGAVGAQGALMEAGETGGVDLVLKGDAFLVQMESAKAPNTEATSADASRFRLALEGSRTFALGESAALTPGLEVGLRHDGGDAETGTGVELGGRMAYANAASGLSVEASARTLIAHEDSGYEEWGASGSVRLDPGASGRGLSFTLAPTLGAASSGVERLWSLRDAQELANDDEFEPEGRLDAEVGYGVPVFGALTGTPYAGLGLSESGRDWRLGWRVSPGTTAFDFELGLEGTWAVPADDEGAPERGVMLQGTLRW